MKSGFTLVELSIVLVIIGMLIGGILVGQSLIDSAKNQAFVREIAQYDAAVMGFQSKYKGIPGDARAMGGNGNNIIADSTCNTATGQKHTCYDNFSGEIAAFWSNLSDSGFQRKGGGSYFNDINTAYGMLTSGPNQTVPLLPLGQNTIAVAFTDMGETQNEVANGEYQKHFYQIFGRDSALSSANATVFTLTPIQALAIDSKMDNGVPGTGNVMAQGIGGLGEMGTVIATNTCPSGGTAYNITITDFVCSLVIKMMVSQ